MKIYLSPCCVMVSFCLFLLIGTSTAMAEAELRGRITDSETGNSLSGALVTLDPNVSVGDDEITTLSDPFGFYYALNLPAATYQVTASHPVFTADYRRLAGGILMMPACLPCLIMVKQPRFAHLMSAKIVGA
ncbi:carboxypeptidase-like regulatory domain-containing protein [Opitutales bacterium]|nr:carboxypeptidase-like regulatory domain-containing protein [Opitutales bacterium]